jgi:acyl carrier protein
MPHAAHPMDPLIAILNEIRPGGNFSDSHNFFDQGLLDSVDLTTLVAELEARYNVFIDVDELVPDNFRSLSAIRAVLVRKGIAV